MSKGKREWRNVLLCCMLWAMFGVMNLAIFYNQPPPMVYFDDKRLSVDVGSDLMVDAAHFCKELTLDVTIDGQQLIVGKEDPQIISMNELKGVSSDSNITAGKVPLEGLCQALGIAYQFDEQEQIVRLGDSSGHALGIPVLMYHHLLPQKDIVGIFQNNDLVVSVENFRAQMDYLKDNGYQCISLARLERYINGEELVPEKSVVITFDDGYLSNYQYAYPILKEHGFTGVIFTLTSYIEAEHQEFDPKRLQYLSWEDIEAMKDIFTFASHTDNMHKLDASGKGVLRSASADQLISDLSVSRRRLNHTPYFSYPYGHYSDLAKDILKRHGVKLAFTATEGMVKIGDDAMTLNRWNVARHQSLDKFRQMLANR